MSGFFGSARSARKGSFWDFAQRRQRTLRNGMSGEDVSRVQNQLNAKISHSPPPLWVDGSFGMKTGQRVREFQQRNQLVVDGLVGPATRGALEADR